MGETKLKVATMTLPAGAKEAWTGLMRGSASVAGSIEQNTPIVQAHAVFADGTQVVGGVLKSDTPAEYNIKFMWVFNTKGERHPGWPIDVGDGAHRARTVGHRLDPLVQTTGVSAGDAAT